MTGEASHWRALAAETLRVAGQLTEPRAQRVMVVIAAAYERLARRAEAHEDTADKSDLDTTETPTE